MIEIQSEYMRHINQINWYQKTVRDTPLDSSLEVLRRISDKLRREMPDDLSEIDRNMADVVLADCEEVLHENS